MDWYKTVFCYSEDGRKMFRYNVKRKAKHQISQLVTECYSNWDNGYYIVGVKNGKKQKLCNFHKDNGMVVLVIDNDYIEK